MLQAVRRRGRSSRARVVRCNWNSCRETQQAGHAPCDCTRHLGDYSLISCVANVHGQQFARRRCIGMMLGIRIMLGLPASRSCVAVSHQHDRRVGLSRPTAGDTITRVKLNVEH